MKKFKVPLSFLMTVVEADNLNEAIKKVSEQYWHTLVVSEIAIYLNDSLLVDEDLARELNKE